MRNKMAIKAWPEGRKDVWMLTTEEAKRIVEAHFETNKRCHSLIPSGTAMLGADWNLDSFTELFESGDHVDKENIWQWIVQTNSGGNLMDHHLTRVEGKRVMAFDIGVVERSNIDEIEVLWESPFKEFH